MGLGTLGRMSDVLDGVFVEFLATRARTVKRHTLMRDVRVVRELQTALAAVESAGGGVTSLAVRQPAAERFPWHGLLTDLDVALLTGATKAMLSQPRPASRGGGVETLEDTQVVLRQLGRWLCRWKAGGIDALRIGFKLESCPATFTWADPQSPTRLINGRPRLRLARDPPEDHASGPADVCC